MVKLEIKHLVSEKNDFEGIDTYHRPIKISNIVSEDDQSSMIVLQTHNGIKLTKSELGYMVIDKKKRVFVYKSSTWAEKKYSRLSKVFARM